MSFVADRPSDYLNGTDYTKFNQVSAFVTATITTNQISANGQEQFKASEDEDFVNTVDIIPDEGNLPIRARVISVKVNVRGSSTNSELKLYQSDGYDGIDQVVEIGNLSQSSSPETYTLSGGMGTPFINKQEENQIHLDINELSGNTSEYDIEVNWLAIHS
jgi:hypothetical protein